MLLLTLIIFLSLKEDSGVRSENDMYNFFSNLLHQLQISLLEFPSICERQNLVERQSDF